MIFKMLYLSVKICFEMLYLGNILPKYAKNNNYENAKRFVWLKKQIWD